MSSTRSGSTEQPAAAGPQGLIERVFATYRDPRGEMRRLLDDRPAEGLLLSLLVLGAFVGLVGQCFEIFADEAARARATAAGPAPVSQADAAEQFRARIGSAFVGRILLFPIAVYLGAGVLTLAARLAGGRGGGYESRAAMIWALLAAAPLSLALSALTAIGVGAGLAADPSEAGALWRGALWVGSLAVGAFALYLWAACVAEAHGFASRARVMGAALGVLAAAAGIWIAAVSLSS